jgi:drug/metabolite transporter (DMT)-like permease
VGFLLLFAGNGGVCWAEQTVPSGVTALLVATVSLWLVFLDWLRPGGHRPVPMVILGLLLGFAGLALLVGPAHLGGTQRVDPLGAAVLVFASLAWACGSLYAKHGGMPGSPMLGVAMQSLTGGVILLMAAFFTGEFRGLHFAAVSLRSWLARVGTYAFVNPVVALCLGWLIAGEPITLRTALAAAVILTAVILVISATQRSPERSKEPMIAPGEA